MFVTLANINLVVQTKSFRGDELIEFYKVNHEWKCFFFKQEKFLLSISYEPEYLVSCNLSEEVSS